MAIITISRGCFSHGKEVAKTVSSMMGYKLLSREILIEEVGQRYHVPEKELIKSVHAPSVLERFTGGKEQYLSYIQAMLLEHAKDDDLVYHGHASCLLLPDIAHVFNVRIIASMKDRVDFMRENHKLSEKEALRHITNEDANRSRWAYYLYKIDITDQHLYDMVINIDRLKIDDAGGIICRAAGMDSFRTTAESREAINDLALVSRIKAAINHACEPGLTIRVTAHKGNVHIHAETPHIRKTGYTKPKTEQYIKEKTQREIQEEISAAIAKIPGIKNVVYDVVPPSYS